MIIGYVTTSVTAKKYSWAVHCYVGNISEKAFTAIPGQCFTTAGYMPRKSQIQLHASALDAVTDNSTETDAQVAKLGDSIKEILGHDKPLLFRNEYLAITGHTLPDASDITPPELIEPDMIYNLAVEGDKEQYPGYVQLWKEIQSQLLKECPDNEIVLISNEKLKKVDPIEGLTLLDGSSGVNIPPGFLEVQVLQRTVTNAGTDDSFELKFKVNPNRFSEYWKPLQDRNPYMYQRYLIHDSIALRRFYTTFDDKLISDFGKRSNTVSYAIVNPKDRDPILDRLMEQELESKLEPSTHYTLIGNIYKPLVNSAVMKYGTSVLLNTTEDRKYYSDDVTVTGRYVSPGLSQRGHEYHKCLEAIFLRYLDGNIHGDLELLDITDCFYDEVDGKRKVKAGIERDGGLVKCPSPGAHKGFQFLVLGKDLPPRNSLNRLTGDVKVMLYSSRDINMVRYGVIISSNEGEAIFSYYNCNVRFVQLGG